MASLLGGFFSVRFEDRYDRLKFVLLTLIFAFVIGSYTIAKELKDSIFVSMVGKEYLPMAKFLVIILLIPAALGYSRLVDVCRRYQLLGFYSLLYGCILAFFTFLLGHSSIGLYNTATSGHRLFGWFLYFFLEGYSPFVVGVFWAFLNSVSTPDEAKKHYPLMVAGSKVGGIIAAYFASKLLMSTATLQVFGLDNHDVVSHQILLGVVSVMLLMIPLFLWILMRSVPGRYLHGYEAVYQMEKKQQYDEKDTKASMLSGIKLLIESRYVLGIFGLVFFYETLNVMLNFQRIGILKEASTSMAGFTASMFDQRYQMHVAGLILSVLGVQFLFQRLDVRRCLMLVPLSISMLLIFFIYFASADSIMYLFIGLSAVNYSLSAPLRESLYIPATKDMKFKAKAWIDTFGTKFSKGFGSLFASVVNAIPAGSGVASIIYMGFFGTLMVCWFITSWMLGKTYEKAIKENKIIGA